ncbi:MAG: hypothetical protein ABWY00_10820 [Dongiaceae bacterium]
MLTRRHLLSGIALGSLVAPLAARPAAALTVEAMPKPLADMAALRCTAQAENATFTTPLPAGEHGRLLSQMRDLLMQKIAAGANPATAQEVAVCPFCGCALTVTAQASF